MKKILSFSLGLILIANYLSAQTNFTAVAGGNWDNNVTWGTAAGVYPGAVGVPGGTGSVTIPIPFGVTLNVTPANPIASLTIGGGNGSNNLTISNGFTLTVTGGVDFVAATSGNNTKSIVVNGTMNAASVTMTAGTTNRTQILQAGTGGTITLTGNLTANATANIDFITAGNGTINIGGNISGGTLGTGSGIINIGGSIPVLPTGVAGFTGTVNFNGGGVQTIPGAVTVANLGVTNAASILTLAGNLTVTGTLTLTNGKINTGTNLLILTNATPANQLSGGSSTSYVYSTGAGRLQRNGLAAATAYPFPIGTATDYMPVTVTPTTVSNFLMSVFSGATTTGVAGGPAIANKSRIVDAVWNIERPVGTGNSTITIQWVDALEGATFATFGNGQIGVSHNVAGVWSAAIANSANAAANTVSATFNAFSPFGVGELGQALPVKFGSIKAYEKQNGIQLDWKVYSENKVRNYEVERSADGRSYTSVGSLPALYNNTSDGDYGFFDANPLAGTSYYRIKNNDLDGKSAYSIVIRVNRNKTIKGLSVYPNPLVNGIVLLQGSDLGRGNYKINIFGANGQEIYKQQLIHNGGTISHSILLPATTGKGVYMLSVKDENGNIIFKEKLVNQ